MGLGSRGCALARHQAPGSCPACSPSTRPQTDTGGAEQGKNLWVLLQSAQTPASFWTVQGLGAHHHALFHPCFERPDTPTQSPSGDTTLALTPWQRDLAKKGADSQKASLATGEAAHRFHQQLLAGFADALQCHVHVLLAREAVDAVVQRMGHGLRHLNETHRQARGIRGRQAAPRPPTFFPEALTVEPPLLDQTPRPLEGAGLSEAQDNQGADSQARRITNLKMAPKHTEIEEEEFQLLHSGLIFRAQPADTPGLGENFGPGGQF